MLQYKWTSVDITSNQKANDMIALFKDIKPVRGATDTESTGLHIILDKPFVVQFGFLHPTEKLGYTFAVDLEQYPILGMEVLRRWWIMAETLKIHAGANIKFDLHMLTNIDILPYQTENYSDVQFYIRYGHDALKPEAGGPPLKLKDYTVRYIDHTAKNHEKKLSQERTAIAADYNLRLKQKLQPYGKPPEKYSAKSYTLGVIQSMFKDPIFDTSDLPIEIQAAYLEWKNELPLWLQNKVQALVEPDMIQYNVLNRKNLMKYAHFDIIYTLEVLVSLEPIVEYRKNMTGVEIENSIIIPLYEMERVGFKTNKEYLEASRVRLKEYIQTRRQKLFDIIGRELQIGQHAVVKSLLQEQFGVFVTSTNADELDLKKADLIQADNNPEAVQFIELIQELRTLEKWYSAYIIRFQKNLRYTDRLYTTIHQVGTVSGRVTSDFQQFPKKAIYTFDETEELFNPRKMVFVPGGDYDALVYLD